MTVRPIMSVACCSERRLPAWLSCTAQQQLTWTAAHLDEFLWLLLKTSEQSQLKCLFKTAVSIYLLLDV